MKSKLFYLLGVIAVTTFSLSSCNPDCKEVTIQKVEWSTRYETYYIDIDTVEEISKYVDTLVSYSIVEHRTKEEYAKNTRGELKGKTIVHYITIRNNNKSYSNRFSVKLVGKEYVESTSKWINVSPQTNYVTISPQSSYTFSIRHSSWWRNESYGYNEGNVSISIIQEPTYVYITEKQIKKITQKRIKRIDKLILSDTIVNDCECDIESLKVKYATIKENFERLKSEHLITTEEYLLNEQQSQVKRIDKLILSDTIGSDCERDKESLKVKCNNQRKPERLKSEHLITKE